MSLQKHILELPAGTTPAEADAFLCVQNVATTPVTRRMTFASLLTLFSTLNTGAWSGVTAYTVGQIVTSGGSAYQCILAHTNQVPPNATYWRLLASIGATGAAGSVWSYGAGAPDNGDGVDGDFYLRTSNSDIYVKGGGVWSIQANIEGATGDSVEWLVQAGVPDNGDGENGDMSLDSSTGDIYGPKAAGVWGSIVANIKGPPGSGVETGGTAGQYLRKVSGTDYDTEWAAIPISEVTGLQAALDLKAPLASPTFTGTPASTTAAPGTNTTQIATTAFVTAAISTAVSGVLDLQGNIDASTNPNYPAGTVGAMYYVSVAGRVGGASGKVVAVGDSVICKADNAGGDEAAVGTSWFVLEKNLDGALLAANNLSDLTNSGTARTNLGLTANGSSLVTAADYAAMRGLLDLEVGTDVAAQSSLANYLPLAGGTLTGSGIIYGVGGTSSRLELTQAGGSFLQYGTSSLGVAGPLLWTDSGTERMRFSQTGKLQLTTGPWEFYRTAGDYDTNYERLKISASSGSFTIAAETGGTGANDIDLILTPAGTGGVLVTGLTASRAVVSDSGSHLVASSVTATELGYLAGVTGSLASANKTLAVGTADASVTNTVTETTLVPTVTGSVTLGAGYFVAGKAFRLTVKGLLTTAAVPGTLRIRVRLGGIGGTVVLDTAAQTPTGALADKLWEVNAIITCRTTGGSGTVIGQSDFYHEIVAVGAPYSWPMVNTAAVTIDTTASQAVSVSAEWGTADAGNIIKVTDFILEQITNAA
mgnify:CR=1 FL=1